MIAGFEAGEEAAQPPHVGCQTQRAIYNRLDFIDCSIVACCVRTQTLLGKYLDPNLANSHFLLSLTAQSQPSPNGDDQVS